MTYRTDPFIPQQAESVKEVVRKSLAPGRWTSTEQIADSRDGVWHRRVGGSAMRQRGEVYGWGTACRQLIDMRFALTRLDGDLDCERCAL